MSVFPLGTSALELVASKFISSIFVRPRYIENSVTGDLFIPDVMIEEHHDDEMVITEHPVEQTAGTPGEISDHAYKRPARLTTRLGWSNSSPAAGVNPLYIDQIYAALISIQANVQLCLILTGKRRLYSNMLPKRIALTTDQKTENSLMLTVEWQELLLAQTQVVTTASNSLQANPAKTGGSISRGPQQLVPQ